MKEKIEKFLEKSRSEQVRILLPYILSSIAFTRIFELIRLCDKNLIKFVSNINYLITPVIHTNIGDVIAGIIIGSGIAYYIMFEHRLKQKNTKMGKEHGGARWGRAEDIRPFIDEDPAFNIILSKTERLSMKMRMPKFNLNRNKHVIVYGGSGSGKTFGFVKPNLYQLHSSYVLTDPKGTLVPETGHLFEVADYNIYILDTIDLAHSMHYNPFAYIREPKDILTFANTLYTNLKPPDAGTPPDPFFDTAALLWLQAIIGLIYYEAPVREQNINTLLFFLESDEVKEDDEDYKNGVDLLFEDLEKKSPRHFAVKQRKKYKKAAGKTAKSILISLGAYLAPFDIPEVAELVKTDDLHFDTYGDEGKKSILYVIISDTDQTYNFIPALLFTQMFNVLCYKADKEYGGKLKTPVQFILDEFANIGKIPGFKILISTIRSRAMSVIMMLQTKSQLKDNYKEAAETIIGNCDSEVFLGGKEKTTLKDLEEALGKETVDLFTESYTHSTNESEGVSFQKTGKSLMDQFDLNTMDRGKCIVQVSGLPPFFSDKYDATSHPNYKHTGDFKDEYIFRYEEYKERQKRKELAKERREDTSLKFKKGEHYYAF